MFAYVLAAHLLADFAGMLPEPDMLDLHYMEQRQRLLWLAVVEHYSLLDRQHIVQFDNQQPD